MCPGEFKKKISKNSEFSTMKIFFKYIIIPGDYFNS